MFENLIKALKSLIKKIVYEKIQEKLKVSTKYSHVEHPRQVGGKGVAGT